MEEFQKFEKDVHYHISQYNSFPTSILETAKSLYSSFNDQSVAFSRPAENFAIASIYLAHRVEKRPTTIRNLAELSGIGHTEIYRAQKHIRNKLMQDADFEIPQFSSRDFIEQYAEKLDLSEEVVDEAKQLLDKGEHAIINCTEPTKAAAALYLAISNTDGMDVSQKRLEEISGITEVTIRNRYKQMEEALSANV